MFQREDYVKLGEIMSRDTIKVPMAVPMADGISFTIMPQVYFNVTTKEY